jgi:NADPH:quinone reductase-like Zn-dependent oxidoreductase
VTTSVPLRGILRRGEGSVKALMHTGYGPVESHVRLEEQSLPAPAGNDVPVRVRFAGINPIDWKLVEGQHKLISRARPPCGVGFELAGEVHEAGAGAAGRFSRGARVAGLIPAFQRPPGAIAQYALVPAHLLVKLPDKVALEEAAALPIAGLSASKMCRLAKIERGRRVLVHGASGGVGHLAAQIARNLGGVVTVTGSQASQRLLQWLRPSAVVDRTTPSSTWGGPFDAVLDCTATLARVDIPRLLAVDGHYVSTVPQFPQVIADTLLNFVRRGKRHVLILKLVPADLEHLMQQLAAGHLRVAIEQKYPLAGAAQALAASRAGHVHGKLVVAID